MKIVVAVTFLYVASALAFGDQKTESVHPAGVTNPETLTVTLKTGDSERSMNSLEFVSKLVGYLAWPLVLAWIVWLFRKEIAGKIQDVESVAYKDAKLIFAQGMRKLRDEHRKFVAVRGQHLGTPLFEYTSIRGADFQKHVFESPKTSILLAWDELRRVLSEVAQKKKVNLTIEPEGIFKTDPVKTLLGHDYDAYLFLQRLRDAAAHLSENDISVKDAEDYIRDITRMIQSLQKSAAGGN